MNKGQLFSWVQNEDVAISDTYRYISDTDTPWILADTHPQSIRINYLNF